MKPITPKQITLIQTLLSRQGLQEQKKDIVQQLTDGRTDSVKELNSNEASMMIQFLTSPGIAAAIPPPQEGDSRHPDNTRMIRYIFAMANEMGWVEKRTVITQNGARQVKAYDKLHDWLNKYGYLKKPLNDYTHDELPTLVTQLQNVWKGWVGGSKK